MAPRAPESKDEFLKRLRASWTADGTARVGIGSPHHSHGVVLQNGRLQVRRLELPKAKVDAYIAEHRTFMPEHAEMLSEPTGAIVYDAASLEELVGLIAAGPWPL